MAQHKSALKRIRQTKVRTARNRHLRSTARGHVRKVRDAVAAGNVADAQAALKVAVGKLARAAQQGVFPRKTASRLASRLTKLVNRAAQ